MVPSIYETGSQHKRGFGISNTSDLFDVCGASADLIDEGKTGFKYKVGDLNKLYKN